MNRIFVIVLLVLAIAGGIWAWSGRRENVSPTADISAVDTSTKAVTPAPQPTATSVEDPNFTGKKLSSNYYEFTTADYEATKKAGRPIFLYFYANWCPTCARQEPIVVQTMNSLDGDLEKFVAFRVNYNDNAPDNDEKKLADEFGVRYQHTMFVLNGAGEQIKKFLGDTSLDQLKDAFKQAI